MTGRGLVILIICVLTLSCVNKEESSDNSGVLPNSPDLAVKTAQWAIKGNVGTVIDFKDDLFVIYIEWKQDKPAYRKLEKLFDSDIVLLYNCAISLLQCDSSMRTKFRYGVCDADQAIYLLAGNDTISFEGFYSNTNPFAKTIDSIHMISRRLIGQLEEREPDTIITSTRFNGFGDMRRRLSIRPPILPK